MPPITKMHPPRSCKEAKDQLKTPFPGHILRLCQKLNKLLEHCRETAAQVRVFVGRIHVKGKSEKYLELYPIQMQMSHISPIAAISIILCQKDKCGTVVE